MSMLFTMMKSTQMLHVQGPEVASFSINFGAIFFFLSLSLPFFFFFFSVLLLLIVLLCRLTRECRWICSVSFHAYYFRSKVIKGYKEHLFDMAIHNMRIFGVVPFIKRQNGTSQLNGEEGNVGYLPALGSGVLVSSVWKNVGMKVACVSFFTV